MTDIGNKMVKGVRWSALEKSGQQGITFVVFAILARFIAPEDFGLVAMALVVIGFLQLFIDQGFSTAVIQKHDVDDAFLSTAFWTNLIVAAVLGGVLIALKHPISVAFNEPRLAELIPWMAFALLFEGLVGVQQALLKRHFDFKGLALRTTFARVIAGAVAIFGAVSGWGVWSLVVFTVLSGALSTAALWWISEWRPGFRFSPDNFRELLAFGGHVTGVRVMTYISSRALEVFIGVFFGAAALGYYTLAYQLVGRIGSIMVQTLSQVTLSGFSRTQASAESLLKRLLGVTRLTTAIVLPLFALIALMAEDVVFLLYGEGWAKSALLIMILAPIGPVMVMNSLLGDAVISAGFPRLILQARGLATVFLVAALLGALQFGFEIMVLVFSAWYYVFMLPLYFAAAKRVLPLRLQPYMTQLVPIVVATVVLIVTVYLARSTVSVAMPHHWVGILTAFLGAAVYLVALAIMDRKILLDLRQILFGFAAR